MSNKGMRWSKLGKWVGVRVNEAVYQSLVEQATREGRAPTTLIRDAIDLYLDVQGISRQQSQTLVDGGVSYVSNGPEAYNRKG